MSSERKKQIFSLLKWRKGKKQKSEEEKAEIPADLDCGSCQLKQEPSLFGRSRSEDSGLDLSNPICLYQKRVPSDTQENISIHSRHTSNSSSLYSYLSCDSTSGLFPRSLSFTALSGPENETKAAQSPMDDDDVFELNNVTQTLNIPYNLAELTELAKSDLTAAAVSKNKTGKENGCEISSNNWCKESKWKTTEESDTLEIVECQEQLRQNSLENQVVSRSATNQMGMLYRLCSLMEKITELERDRLELLRQNTELQDQLAQSQQAQITFLNCCTCNARAGVNTSHTATQQTTFISPPVTKENPTTETMRSRVSSEASVRSEVTRSRHQQAETLTLGSTDELHLCVSRV
ncbi:uncharacterized protein LOC127569829 [Pristis pectinata]|uniref:uncharacterized protein LOC127569829 n=1 Tax=Pristis pectinata TaxID=685728 RepID=UPI00223CA3B6|nr:uncharacterized protein LOC127569829 [Pristis pectinata]